MDIKKKILIFIVAYNAENFIKSVLQRIPKQLLNQNNLEFEILIIDDSSADSTFKKAVDYKNNTNDMKSRLVVMRNPVNLGYGGNQKLGYQYAIDNGFDLVVLLHGDGQYAPEELPRILDPILNNTADYVLGSRMLDKRSALKGRMPLYKFIGNLCLTKIQNLLLKSSLAEFHTGYRAYSVSCLKKIPFTLNSNDFDFDTEILIQLIDNGFKCIEIQIPTFYGNETCHVNGVKYAFNIIKTTIISRLQPFGMFYKPKFDYEEHSAYPDKTSFDSSHTWAISMINHGSVVLDIGCGSGHIAKKLRQKECTVYGIDQYIDEDIKYLFEKTFECNLNTNNLIFENKKYDYLLLMDVIEHLDSPEKFFLYLRNATKYNNQKVIISTGNVAFLPTRLSLLFGNFNYGKKGILDMTHKRLFTFGSLLKCLKSCGYKIEKVEGIPAPFPVIFGRNLLGNTLCKINRFMIAISKRMFAYQIAIVALPQPTTKQLLSSALKSS